MRKRADLNPPLGFPGGPCYVADRATGHSNSKKILDLLEQTGGIPKNLERSIYPERHIQKSRGKFSLSLSSHAQYRMDLRGITVPILTKAFSSFEEWFLNILDQRKRSPEAATRFNRVLDDMRRGEGFTWHDKRTGLVLGIHYKPNLPTNTLLIATAYWKGSRKDNQPKAPGKGTCTVDQGLDRGRSRRDEDPLLNLLTRNVAKRWAAYQQPASELAGVRTFVTEKSDKGISDPNQPSSYLPSDSPEHDGYRGKALPSDHSKARTKYIPQPAFNAPGSSQDGNPIKMRTPSTPGAQYGHPYIDQGTTLHKRRAILAVLNSEDI